MSPIAAMVSRKLLPLFFIFSLNAFAEPKTILWIGDSFSFFDFGERIRNRFRKEVSEEFQLIMLAAIGIGPKDVTTRKGVDAYPYKIQNANEVFEKANKTPPSVKALIEKHKPYAIIVQLGLNLDYYARPDIPSRVEDLKRDMNAFTKELQSLPQNESSRIAPVLWLTPFLVDKSKNKTLKGDQEFLFQHISSLLSANDKAVDGRHISSPDKVDIANSSDGFHIEWGSTRYADNFFDKFLIPWLRTIP